MNFLATNSGNGTNGVPLMLFLSIFMLIVGTIATMLLRTSTDKRAIKNFNMVINALPLAISQ